MKNSRILEVSGPRKLAEAAKKYLDDSSFDAVHVHSFANETEVASLSEIDSETSPAASMFSDEIQLAFAETTKVVEDWVKKTKFGGLVLDASLHPAEFIRGDNSESPAHIDPRITDKVTDYFAGPLTMSLGIIGRGKWNFCQAPYTLDKQGNFSVDALNSVIITMKRNPVAPTSSLVQESTDLVVFRGVPHPIIHGVSRLSEERMSALYDYRLLETPLLWLPPNPVIPGSALLAA